MTLKEYTKKVNTLLKEECDRINSDPDRLFRAPISDVTESHMKMYVDWGYSPEQAIKHMYYDTEEEARWEARVS